MNKVFLGIGHGGRDSGAFANGRREADLNLVIGLACRNELERYGVQVLMSRTKDEDDTLSDEIKECNVYNPNLAVDIHNNAGGGDGFEAYYSLANSIRGARTKELAAKIEAEVEAIGQKSRGLKIRPRKDGRDHFGFVRECKCPSILIECAFIDTKDVQIIDTPPEQRAMGVAVAKGILKALEINLVKPQKKQSYYVKTGEILTKEKAEEISALLTNAKCYNTILNW